MTATPARYRPQSVRLVLVACVVLVVPPTVLGLFGLFVDRSVTPTAFSWGMTTWLVAPYLALAALCLWAARSDRGSFRLAVELTTTVIAVQSVLLSLVTLTSDQDMAAVGVLFSPVLYLGAALVLVVVGAVQHLVPGRAVAPVVEPVRVSAR